MPRLLNVVYALLTQNKNDEDRAEIDRILDGPPNEEELRATWGMTPDAEAGQNAFLRMAAMPRG